MNIGDYVEYRISAGGSWRKQKCARGTVIEVHVAGEPSLAKVQLAESLFGYDPPEQIITDVKNLWLLGRDQGVKA